MAPQIEFSFQLTEEDVALACAAFSFRWRRLLLPGVATSLVGVLGAIALIVLQPDWLGVEFPQWLGIDFGVIAAGLVLAGWGKVIPFAGSAVPQPPTMKSCTKFSTITSRSHLN